MKIKTKTINKIIGTLENGETIDFRFEPDAITEPRVFIKDNTMIVGYLIHDQDADDPLTACDGNGRIYSADRHAVKTDIESCQRALGLNKYWSRNEDIPINPYAVLLDCYERSGIHWSVSEAAARRSLDQLIDNAPASGIWVPDETAQDECDRRAEVYACFTLTESRLASEPTYSLTAQTEPFMSNPGLHQATFDNWGLAFEAARKAVAEARDNGSLPTLTPEQILNGKNAASEEMAKTACELFNQWLNGESYIIVIANYERADENSKWEEIAASEDEAIECLGNESAIEELDVEFKAACNNLEADNDNRMS